MTICLNILHSARESPVAWEEASAEGGDNDQPSQLGEPESHSSPGAEEEAKEEQPQPEDEGSTSGVGDWMCRQARVTKHGHLPRLC